jgi:hypothetical protein
MARRASLLALLAALVVGGCAYGTPAKLTADQKQARIAFLKAHGGFDDHDLAKLCPGMYPTDFLTDTKKWPAGKPRKNHTSPKVTAADRADAKAAGCDVRP